MVEMLVEAGDSRLGRFAGLILGNSMGAQT